MFDFVKTNNKKKTLHFYPYQIEMGTKNKLNFRIKAKHTYKIINCFHFRVYDKNRTHQTLMRTKFIHFSLNELRR